jgi:hypothetical protein
MMSPHSYPSGHRCDGNGTDWEDDMKNSTLKRFAAGALMSLSVAMAGAGLTVGNAQAFPGGQVPLGS